MMRIIRKLYWMGIILLLTQGWRPADLQAHETVTLQLKWFHQFQFAGYYAAAEKGFYKDVGLTVRFIEGDPSVIRDTYEEVLSSRAQYGVSNTEVLLKRLNGAPLVVISSIFQHSPLLLMTRQDAGIHSPHDLIGKQVMIGPKSRTPELHAIFINEGISLNQIDRLVPQGNFPDYLFDDTIKAFGAYSTNEPFFLQQKNIAVKFLHPQTYGIDFYGDILFTTETEIKKHPDRVRRFREASLKGWEYAMAHPAEIIDLILEKYNPKKTRGHLEYEAETMKDLIRPEFVRIGHINPGRWRHIADTYVQLGMAKPDYSLKGFIYYPDAAPDYRWLYRLLMIAGVLLGTTGAVLGMLAYFNIRLRRMVEQRTLELIQRNETLIQEIESRKQIEKKLKESEEKYKSLINDVLDSSEVGVFILDKQFDIVWMNQAIATYFGLKRDEVIGKDKRRVIREKIQFIFEKSETFAEKVFATYDNNNYVENFECRVLAGGHREERWLEHWSQPINFGLYKGGRIEHYYDITPRKRLERQLKGYSEHLEEMVEKRTAALKKAQEELLLKERLAVLGHFAGSISHEIRNPLSAVNNSAYFLKMRLQQAEPKIHEHLGFIVRAVQEANAIIQSLLDLTRLKKPVTFPHDLTTLISDTFATTHIPNSVEIVKNYPENAVFAPVDAHQIRMALKNIVNNAVQAMDESGKLTISIVPEKSGEVEITIADTGPGIPPEYIEKVFEPLFSTKTHGIGFGLSITKMIVENHGGMIRAESAAGSGTVIRLTLPAPNDGRDALMPSSAEAPASL